MEWMKERVSARTNVRKNASGGVVVEHVVTSEEGEGGLVREVQSFVLPESLLSEVERVLERPCKRCEGRLVVHSVAALEFPGLSEWTVP